LKSAKNSGVVLCHQVKTIDFIERGLKLAEKARKSVVSEVLSKVKAIVSE
jgi:mRNA interferase MazF